MSKAALSYTYYPGCSLHSTGVEYGLSTRAVFKRLEIELTGCPTGIAAGLHQLIQRATLWRLPYRLATWLWLKQREETW